MRPTLTHGETSRGRWFAKQPSRACAAFPPVPSFAQRMRPTLTHGETSRGRWFAKQPSRACAAFPPVPSFAQRMRPTLTHGETSRGRWFAKAAFAPRMRPTVTTTQTYLRQVHRAAITESLRGPTASRSVGTACAISISSRFGGGRAAI